MPSFFSLDAAKAVIPSIWESGYVMILDAIKVLWTKVLQQKVVQAN
jgi:hypothetical protein